MALNVIEGILIALFGSLIIKYAIEKAYNRWVAYKTSRNASADIEMTPISSSSSRDCNSDQGQVHQLLSQPSQEEDRSYPGVPHFSRGRVPAQHCSCHFIHTLSPDCNNNDVSSDSSSSSSSSFPSSPSPELEVNDRLSEDEEIPPTSYISTEDTAGNNTIVQ